MRQGEAVDAGDCGNDGLGLLLVRAAVAQGSVCGVRAAVQAVVVVTAAAKVTQGFGIKDSSKTGEGRR